MTSTKLNKWTNMALFSVILLSLGLTACDNPADDDDAGEQEFITKITIRLEEQGSQNVVNIVWSDPNGDGIGDFTGTANIKSNRTYKGTIELLNELTTDLDERDVTKEIEEEADEHQFFYTFSSNLAPFAVVTITDRDSTITKTGSNPGNEEDVNISAPVTISAQ